MNKKLTVFAGMVVLGCICFSGCGSLDGGKSGREEAEAVTAEGAEEEPDATVDGAAGKEGGTGLEGETGADGQVDFEALRGQNPDIFAWLYVPGAGIDAPVLQSGITDDFYMTHTADGKEGEAGALYTEMANLMNMCDFNTVIHGKDEKEGDILYGLHLFENPDFFAKHKNFYIYLPDNVLTYEIVAAYYDEESDILRRHDYTTYQGCQDYLEEMYGARDMGKNFREGWEEITPYHFLVTLDGGRRKDMAMQYVVVGVLMKDAAGKVERVILD